MILKSKMKKYFTGLFLVLVCAVNFYANSTPVIQTEPSATIQKLESTEVISDKYTLGVDEMLDPVNNLDYINPSKWPFFQRGDVELFFTDEARLD